MIYWSFDKIPELAAKSPAERQAVAKVASKLAMKHWEWWAALLFACVATGLGAWLGGRGLTGVLGAGLGGGVGGAVHQVVVIHLARKFHATALPRKSEA